jgi:uncharacterized integral membrane protein
VRREHREGDEPDGPITDADQDRLRQLKRHRQVRAAKAIVVVVILTLLILFIVWNSHSVQVNYVFFKARNSLIWVMVVCTLLGGIVGFIVGRPGRQFRFRHEDERK